MILSCKCQHEVQDKLHGRGNRVHNMTVTDKGHSAKYRCTVCGNEREAR